jgi:hypothetical protein
MFVFRFNDGRYLKDLGIGTTIRSKQHFDLWKFSSRPWADRYGPGGDQFEQHITTDINEAKTFVSVASVRSSNAYSWGGDVLEVKVRLELA